MNDQTPEATDLTAATCKPCEGGVDKLDDERISDLLRRVPDWQREGDAISRSFRFKDFYQTMAFVNGVAWIANRENHHPDLEVGYDRCKVSFTTHAIDGLSENDFICAAKIDQLVRM